MPQSKFSSLQWQIEEYTKHKRSRNWYIIASLLALIALFFSFFTIQNWHFVFLGVNSNFLFALIILLVAIIMIINDGQDPMLVDFKMDPEGITIGRRFYDYDEIKNFSVLYKPKDNIKNIYFEFRNSVHPRLSIPLNNMDALKVRNFLIKYLDENLERVNPPLSEQLTKLLKL